MIKALKERIIGWDLLRFLVILAILEFHLLETFFYVDRPLFGDQLFLNFFTEPYVRTLAFGGFIIISLSSFLWGRSHHSSRHWLQLLVLLIFGYVCLALLEAEGDHWFYFEWDIYSYLLVSFALLFLVQLSQKITWIASFIGLILLSIAGNYEGLWNLQGNWQSVLVGDCSVPGRNEWPLLPWIGLPLLFFALGRSSRKQAWPVWRNWEWALWPVLLLGSLPQWGAYYHGKAGPSFYCDMQGQTPLVFWSHMIWPIFWVRISALSPIQNLFKRFWPLRSISQLHWSRHFGLCYALHLLWINVLYVIAADQIMAQPFLIEPLILVVLVGTELSSRGVICLWTLWRAKYQTAHAKTS